MTLPQNIYAIFLLGRYCNSQIKNEHKLEDSHKTRTPLKIEKHAPGCVFG